jgi:heme exporter protein B
VIWVAALLAAILPLDRLVEPDVEAGLFDQWALRGLSEEVLLMVRIVAHWISFGVPLLLAAPLAAGLLARWRATGDGRMGPAARHAGPGRDRGDDCRAHRRPACRGGAGRAARHSAHRAAADLGAGSLQPGGEGGLGLLAACSLVALAVAPLPGRGDTGGTRIRAARE